MSRVALITGGNGFLGSHLADRLAKEGWQVHITSRFQSVADKFGNFGHICDFNDVAATSKLFEKIQPEIVVHLAGAVSASPYIELALPTLYSHLVSAVSIMTLVERFQIRRLVLVGSFTEGIDRAPSSPYGAAKNCVRMYSDMFYSLYETPVVLVRPFMTFGPRQEVSKVLPYIIRNLLTNETPKLSSGNLCADWIYVSDVIEGFWRAIVTPGIDGETVDLGRGELVSLRCMAERVTDLMGSSVSPIFGARADRPDEPEVAADILKTSKLLDWHPNVDIDEGLAKTIESYT